MIDPVYEFHVRRADRAEAKVAELEADLAEEVAAVAKAYDRIAELEAAMRSAATLIEQGLYSSARQHLEDAARGESDGGA